LSKRLKLELNDTIYAKLEELAKQHNLNVISLLSDIILSFVQKHESSKLKKHKKLDEINISESELKDYLDLF
jgi:hypothetical protein